MRHFIQLTYLLLVLLLGVMACDDEQPLPTTQPQPQPQPQNRLIAKAGDDVQVPIGTLVDLDGSASVDGNGNAFTYAWTLREVPSGSSVSLSEVTAVTTSFTPDVAGRYVLELKIANDSGIATDEITITATTVQEPNEPAAVIISEHIVENRVLEDIFTDPSRADYIVTADVWVFATLTVNPGVRIEFEQDRGLTIYREGVLIAKGINDGTGTHDKRITFTGTSSTKGFWKGILLMSNSPLNELEYASIDYAGSSSFDDVPSTTTANLVLLGDDASGAALKVTGSYFSNSAGNGMSVYGRSELITFENNYFDSNEGSALYVPAQQLHKLDFFSHYTGNNGFNGVETGGVLYHDTDVVWPDFNDGSGYLVSSDLSIQSGLSIQAGATFEFKEGLVLHVNGAGFLDASGTAASAVVFTAASSDPHLAWGGILFQNSSAMNQLYYTEVVNAGNKEVPFYPGMKASVAVAATGKATIMNSVFRKSGGWGLLAFMDRGAQLNENVTSANEFGEALTAGAYKLTSVAPPNAVPLAGQWLDQASYTAGHALDELFYDRTSNLWFRGASDPWTMSPRAGFGIKIDSQGNYTWTIAQRHDPIADCGVPYSAEYLTGRVTAVGSQLQFVESYWRTKFYHPCDATMNVDSNVAPGSMLLNYQIEMLYNMFTGEPACWQLTIYSLDGSSFKYFKPLS